MYENYNKQKEHGYLIAFKPYEKKHLPKGGWMTDGEFENAEVTMSVEQMDIKCGFV
jgi:hypothetical protein